MLDTYVIDGDALMVARPKGILNAELALRIVEFIEIKEIETESGFNRFCDLSRLQGVQLAFDEVDKIAQRRSAFNPNLIRVKSAFLATNLLAHSVAVLCQSLLQSPRIEVQVFESLEEAAKWLGVGPEKLKL